MYAVREVLQLPYNSRYKTFYTKNSLLLIITVSCNITTDNCFASILFHGCIFCSGRCNDWAPNSKCRRRAICVFQKIGFARKNDSQKWLYDQSNEHKNQFWGARHLFLNCSHYSGFIATETYVTCRHSTLRVCMLCVQRIVYRVKNSNLNSSLIFENNWYASTQDILLMRLFNI